MTDSAYTLKHPFRDAMASCAAGVHVITTDGESGRYGITMTAVTPRYRRTADHYALHQPQGGNYSDSSDQPRLVHQYPVRKPTGHRRTLCRPDWAFPLKNALPTIFGTGAKPGNLKSKTHWRICTDVSFHNTKSGRILSFTLKSTKIKKFRPHIPPALLYFRRQFKSLE